MLLCYLNVILIVSFSYKPFGTLGDVVRPKWVLTHIMLTIIFYGGTTILCTKNMHIYNSHVKHFVAHELEPFVKNVVLNMWTKWDL